MKIRSCHTRVVKATLKKNKVIGLILPDFKTYKVTVIKTEWCWHRDRQKGQWGGRENVEKDPHAYGQLVLQRQVRGERIVGVFFFFFNQMVLEQLNLAIQTKTGRKKEKKTNK